MKKLTLFFALLLGMFLFPSVETHAAAVPRVMAYDLKSEKNTPEEGFTRFTFSTNTKPTKAYLIFYHAGNEVYRKDITTQAQKQLKNATYTIRTSDLPELTNMKWAIEVQGDPIANFACVNNVNDVAKYGFNRPQAVAIDNNPESDFFGRMYIALPKAGGSSSSYGAYGDTQAGIVVFDAVHNRLASGIIATGSVLGDETMGIHRVAVNPINGKVYYTKSIASNTAVYELTPDATDILSDEGTAVNAIAGLGLTRADAVCFAEDGTMFVMDNASYSGGAKGKIYKIKDGTKTIFNGDALWSNSPNSLASDGNGGIWVAQFRGAVGALPIMSHINSSGVVDYKFTSDPSSWLSGSNASKGGTIAYNPKDKVIALSTEGGIVMLFQVTETDGKPVITNKLWSTPKISSTGEVNGIAFDYAGNLIFASRSSERLCYYAVPTTTNSCTTPAKSTMQVDGPPTCRVLPHDLTVVNNGDSYTFKYKTNTNAQSGYLVFYKEDGKTVDQKIALPTPIQRNVENQITVAKSALPKRHGITWGIELTGKAVPKYSYLQQITDQTRQIYDFYNMMGVVVDNNPESDYFGKIYVQATLNGASDGATTRADNQKAGLFIYNQWLDELNPTSNVGIQPSLPSGYSIGSANQFNRLAIDPTTNNITYCYAVSGKPAVFSMDRANLTGTPTNLLAGQTGITRSVAHCFDAEGNLYVMDLPGSGQIFKIDKEGNKTTFGALTNKFVNQSMSMASDGRGGLWVGQNRGAIDTYYQLVHYNASGTIDFSVYQGNDHGFTGNSTRGALAYDAERQILAQGRNGSVILFNVTYDASTGVPTLTQQSVPASIAHNNIDGLAFDYAGDLYVVNSGKEKFYKFTIPTDNNTCLVPAKSTLTIDGEVGEVAYELNGGVWNEYGWNSKDDMYSAILIDIDAITPPTQAGTNVNAITLTEDKIKGVKLGIPTYWSNLTVLLTHASFKEKWGWLIAYMDDVCSAQNKTKPSIDQASLRYNLSAFFLEDQYTSWPYSADFTEAGKDAAYIPVWGQSYGNPEFPINEVKLYDPCRKGYKFGGWYKEADFSGTPITIVDQNFKGTLYAKWTQSGIVYDLNGGVWNQYGWESKKDMYDAFIADWKAYSGSTRATKTYEEQYGIGKSNDGIPVTIKDDEDILGFMAQKKWEWLGQFLDALAIAQGKETMPTTAVKQMRFGLGNFFGEDNNQTGWLGAVDCSGNIASLSAFAPYWGQTFPLPTQPTEEVVLNAPYKEKGYEFDGWYTTSNFSSAEVTMVDENTNGTLYAKWTRNEFTRSVTSGRYGTICLPYNANYFEGAIFYEVSWMNKSVSPWQVLVEEVTELEAGKPYIFMAKSNNILVACQGDAIADPSSYNGLHGTFRDINDGPAGTPSNVLEGNHMLSNNQIMKCLGNCQLLANRAYFKLGEIPTVEPALVPGRRRVALGVQGGNEATGLDNLTEDGIAPAMEGTYDVLGRKMTETTNTGFYIVNGKKVVVVK